MPSFDTVLEADFVEVKNAVDNSAKEIGTRFDFKGSSAGLELKDKEITLFGDADFQLQQVEDILRNKLTKRNVDVRFMDVQPSQKIGGDKVKQVVKIKNGIESELAKKIQKLIKESKMKVQAAIQGDVLGEGAVQGAGNVAGDRVQGLDLATVAGRGARIDQGLARLLQCGQHIGRAGQLAQRGTQLKVGLEPGGFGTAGNGTTACLPGLQAAVEHSHCIVTEIGRAHV